MISRRGDLVLKENGQETILLKCKGKFDPKFGRGYYNPTLSQDGKKVAFQYLAGLKSGDGVFEMDIQTKKQKQLAASAYFDPQYSPDGKFLLLCSNQRETKNNTWISDLYILDIETGTLTKIAEGDSYLWR